MKTALNTDREVKAAKALVSQTEKMLAANPWTALALAAGAGLLLGVLLARR
jgi:ElaB/YqjD/DUF883 family membrane-anchored ribosome-binding protein